MYQFCFSSELTSGSIEAELLDKEKQKLLILSGHESRELFLEEGKKYYLILHFHSADGAYHLERR